MIEIRAKLSSFKFVQFYNILHLSTNIIKIHGIIIYAQIDESQMDFGVYIKKSLFIWRLFHRPMILPLFWK